MTLHGPIKVNEHGVGYWSARRVVTGEDGWNEYECTLIWHAEDMIPVAKEFKVSHLYTEGPAVLAAKVLAKGVGLVVDYQSQPRKKIRADLLREAAERLNKEGLDFKDGGWGSNEADQQTIDVMVKAVNWLREWAKREEE